MNIPTKEYLDNNFAMYQKKNHTILDYNLFGTRENKNVSKFADVFLLADNVKWLFSRLDIELCILLEFVEKVLLEDWLTGYPERVDNFMASGLFFRRLLSAIACTSKMRASTELLRRLFSAIAFTSKITVSRTLRNGFGLKQQWYRCVWHWLQSLQSALLNFFYFFQPIQKNNC